MSFSVPKNAIEGFKCLLCSNYLSYFPVYIIGDRENICGRCTRPENQTGFRNYLYESAVEHFLFPCCYENQGCRENLLPKEVISHENSCFFKWVSCPGLDFLHCRWEGPLNNRLLHCLQNHEDMFLKDNTVHLYLDSSVNMSRFLQHEEHLFKVSLNYDCESSVFESTVNHFNGNIFNYKLIISKDKMNLTLESTTNCVGNLKIYLDFLKNYSQQNLPVTLKFILEKTGVQPDRISNPPSYSVCSVCRKIVSPSELCTVSNTMFCTRCILLKYGTDKIISKLNIPCKYQEDGCHVVLKSKKMESHQLTCLYERRSCCLSDFVSCDWIGLRKDLETHIRKNHNNMIVRVTTKCSLSCPVLYNNISWKSYIIQKHDALFRLVCCVDNRKKDGLCKWIVDWIEPVHDNFWFEIELVPKPTSSKFSSIKNLRMRRKCSSLLHKKDKMFAEQKDYCYFTKDQCVLFMGRSIMEFNVYISEEWP